jgi:Domain of unknown function (DUF4129)
MFKYLFCLAFFFLSVECRVWAQTETDSSSAVADTIAPSGDSVQQTVSADSLYDPVSDSGFLSNYSLRKVPERTVNGYLRDPDYAYANDPEYWRKTVPPEPGLFSRFLNSKTFRWVIFFFVIAVVLYGIYQLARENNFTWFSSTRKKDRSPSSENLPEEEIPFDESIIRYQSEGNYRLAIRYMYLRLLHTVRTTGGLQIHDSSTNAEIVRAFGDRQQAGEFRYLATAYEYIFYGEFIPGEALYHTLKSRFEHFQQTFPA